MPSPCMSAVTPIVTLSTSRLGRRHAGAWCEAEALRARDKAAQHRSLDLWREHFPKTPFNGSLVVAHARDRADFERFAKLTTGHVRLDAQGLSDLEPSLEGRFRDGLFYAGEGDVEPRKVLPELHARIEAAGGTVKFDCDMNAEDLDGIVIDCRGLSARDEQPELRGVKGEMIIVETSEGRAVGARWRLIHPRWPLYVIPRGDSKIHARRNLDRGRGHRRQRALGAGAAGRGLCRASGLCRGAHRRVPGSGLRSAYPDNLRGSRSTRRFR